MTKMIQPVILSGGAGTRLWPLSREMFPKQMLALTSELTLIQETARRTAQANRFAAPVVICNADHRFLIQNQLGAIGQPPQALLIEPIARNTAAALATIALYGAEQDPEQLLLVMPSDHLISQPEAFLAAISAGEKLAQAGHIVTFGITPDRPETGYGYIKQGNAIPNAAGYAISSFVEKPDRATAEAYIREGTYLWNGGLFFAKASVLLAEFRLHAPDILEAATQALQQAKREGGVIALAEAPLRTCPAKPFDKAVMEKTSHGAVVPVSMGWSDIGTWNALWLASAKDENGNALIGPALRCMDSHNCYIRSEKTLTAVIGAQDMAVIVTDDAVLVAPRERVAETGKLVEQMKADGISQTRSPAVVHRPWGTYESIASGEGYQSKRIIVNCGGRLSLQKHHKRAEHWTVVAGKATVTVGERVMEMGPNESVYIPLGEVHRLENFGTEPVVLIEVQCGSYLGEDDIVRLEDVYAREKEPAKA